MTILERDSLPEVSLPKGSSFDIPCSILTFRSVVRGYRRATTPPPFLARATSASTMDWVTMVVSPGVS